MELCSLRSGSTGNAILAQTGKTKILIDCGISGKAVLGCLACLDIDPNEISAVLVTHEHSDHVKGIGILARKLKIPIYANTGTWKAMYGSLGKIEDEWVKVFATGTEFEIGDIGVRAFDIPHDAAEPVGYCLCGEGKQVAVATDMGEIWENVTNALAGSRTVLLESNHDVHMLEMGGYPYPLKQRVKGQRGHLSNEQAGQLAVKLVQSGTTQILLGHLSQENNYPQLAYQTVKNELEANGIQAGKDVWLGVAQRDAISRIGAESEEGFAGLQSRTSAAGMTL
uniref:MBL fold metallo-hydrolase n=1 Tax=uncultured Bacillota bacterium TaxID=344338 RepID=A0A650EPN5_9FIRM|nr:MBL fold metallo-hydrolase [uncultured Firmicutes bacterium]